MTRQLIILGASGFLGSSIPTWFEDSFDNVLKYGSSDCDLTCLDQLLVLSDKWNKGATVCLFAVINKPIGDTKEAYEKNIKIAENVAKVVEQKRASQLLFTSSVDVYGLTPASPVYEESKTAPDNWYGRAKLKSEAILLQKSSSDLEVGIFRCPGIYNFTDSDPSVIGIFRKKVLSGNPITLRNEGKNKRSFAYTEDLYKLFQLWCKRPKSAIWNAAPNKSSSMEQVARTIISYLQTGHIIFEGTDQRDFDLEFDVSKTNAFFRENPIRPIELVFSSFLTKQT